MPLVAIARGRGRGRGRCSSGRGGASSPFLLLLLEGQDTHLVAVIYEGRMQDCVCEIKTRGVVCVVKKKDRGEKICKESESARTYVAAAKRTKQGGTWPFQIIEYLLLVKGQAR